jgi:hypothetical protein
VRGERGEKVREGERERSEGLVCDLQTDTCIMPFSEGYGIIESAYET